MDLRRLCCFIVIGTFLSCNTKVEERVKYSKYFKNVIESKCHYILGTKIKQGQCIEFSRKGDTLAVLNYQNDLLHGQQTYFNENNKSRVEMYKNGKLEGVTAEFYKNGKLKFKVVYKNDKLWNILKVLDLYGEPLDYGEFKDGNGFVKVYSSLGRIEYMGKYIGGVPDGNWLTYTDTGAKDTIIIKEGYSETNTPVYFY